MRPIIFFGSDHFALSHLVALGNNNLPFKVILVVTGSMSTPVAKYCAQLNIPYLDWPKAKPIANMTIDQIVELSPPTGVAVVVSFGRFLPQRLRRAMDCVINVHPSLLPRWRGASPLMYTLLVGDCISGVSIMQIPVEGGPFDTGPILLQRSVALPADLVSSTQLAQYLTPLGIEALIEVLCDLRSNLTHYVTQKYLPLPAPKPRQEMAFVDWKNQSAEEIERLWRALSDWFYLSTSLVRHFPTTDKNSIQFISTEVEIRLIEHPIILHPPLVDEIFYKNVGFQNMIATARDLLADLDSKDDVSPGDIIYIERGEDNINKHHPSRDFLFPIVCVAASGGSWLGLHGGLVIGHTKAKRRPLAPLDFYSGYFTSRPDCWRIKCLQNRVWNVGTFKSRTPNPLYPLPTPLCNID